MKLKDYEKPLYIHVGNVRTAINVTKFEDKCFEPFLGRNPRERKVEEGKIWKVAC